MNISKLSAIAVKYWEELGRGNRLDVLYKPQGHNWRVYSRGENPSFNFTFNYMVTAPVHTELALKHLNEGVEIEVVGIITGLPIEDLVPNEMLDAWADKDRIIKEKKLYKDGEVWWCYMGEAIDCNSPLLYKDGKWFYTDASPHGIKEESAEGFKPLYKIGELQ